MGFVRFVWQLSDRLLRRGKAPGYPGTTSDKEFFAELDQQFAQVHERQWHHAAGLWRPTEECPSSFRIQTGELSDRDRAHINTCHLCWLIYDLSRFDRWAESVRKRKPWTWLIHHPSPPIWLTLPLLGLLISGILLYRPPAVPPVRLPSASLHSFYEPLGNATPAVGLKGGLPEQRRASLEAELRKLPPEIELQRRLGPRPLKDFESLRESIAVFVPAHSALEPRLIKAWLETIRSGGNGLLIQVVRHQTAIAGKIPPGYLVQLAEINADLAGRANATIVSQLLDIQSQVVTLTHKEIGRRGNTKIVGERVLAEAKSQRDSAAPSSIGEVAALREAKMRLHTSAIARN